MYSQHATLSDVVAEYESLRARYASAVRTLQRIAKVPWAADADARDTLIQLGEPVEPEGM
jgi:hypothetical protein